MEAADPRSSSDGAPASRGGFPGGESSSDRDGGRAGGSGGEGEREQRERATFECNICLDTARDAVISLCGHLFWYRRLFFNFYSLQTASLLLIQGDVKVHHFCTACSFGTN